MHPSYAHMQSPNHRPGKLDMLSQHAVIQTSYPSMQSPNHKPGKLDMLFQHVVEINQVGKVRNTIPSCTAKYALYKRDCKSPTQWTS